MATVVRLKWNETHYLWNSFNLGEDYVKYLSSEYGLETTGQCLWNHTTYVIDVIIPQTPIPQSARAIGPGLVVGPKQPDRRKKIRLVFKLGEETNTQTKYRAAGISIRAMHDIKMKIEEHAGIKVGLVDVKIVER